MLTSQQHHQLIPASARINTGRQQLQEMSIALLKMLKE
jgi:hypothetical protein